MKLKKQNIAHVYPPQRKSLVSSFRRCHHQSPIYRSNHRVLLTLSNLRLLLNHPLATHLSESLLLLTPRGEAQRNLQSNVTVGSPSRSSRRGSPSSSNRCSTRKRNGEGRTTASRPT